MRGQFYRTEGGKVWQDFKKPKKKKSGRKYC